MAINLPSAYSKILDKSYSLKSLTAPAFKGEYQVVGGTTKTFKVYSIEGQDLEDYSARKKAGASFGFDYKDVANVEQIIEATQDKYFAITIDKADAKFANGLLDASNVMQVQIDEKVIPMIDKYNLAKLGEAAKATTKASGKETAYENFTTLMTEQTNAFVPATGRVAFCSASFFAKLRQDPAFAVDSEMTANARRTGNYGRVDGALIVEVPDSYMPTDTDVILTHEKAAAAPKHLVDYHQGEFKERASGYFVNGRIVHEAWVFNKKKPAVVSLKSK